MLINFADHVITVDDSDSKKLLLEDRERQFEWLLLIISICMKLYQQAKTDGTKI